MSILKYYKVESDGKIKRLRRECPSAECGAGIFVSTLLLSYSPSRLSGTLLFQMAFHKDRQYCGKCGLTYTFAAGSKPPTA